MANWSTDPRLTVPDGGDRDAAFAKVTHLAVCAHPDDLEIMAYPAILACFDARTFAGVVLTGGGGGPRGGPHAHASDAAMIARRASEQRAVAAVGRYAALAQLGWTSGALRDSPDLVVDDLAGLLAQVRPQEVWLHSPFDRHPTHVAAFRAGIAAVRRGPPPARLLGGEVWGSLDWLPRATRVACDVGDRPHLAAALIGAYDSQIAGGKRYDLAAAGRWSANAVFHDPHLAAGGGVALAADLRGLLDPGSSVSAWVEEVLAAHAQEVRGRLGGAQWRS